MITPPSYIIGPVLHGTTAWQVAIRSSWKSGQGEQLANNVRKGSAVTVF